ncbi:hypothetical protein K501DRAFT_328470 [Backusella circina FSU 941]|nr:hypothetical protein K501DRAFT_328470 [Backusella circina FSU 941]
MTNIDIAATAFYELGPLPEIVANILNRHSIDELHRGIPSRDIAKVGRILKRVRFYSIHRNYLIKPSWRTNKIKPVLDRFFREIVSGLIDKGMNVANRNPIMITTDPQGNIENILKDAGLKAFIATKKAPELIFCFVNTVPTALYLKTKHVSDTVFGIPTQCVQSRHIADANEQYCANATTPVSSPSTPRMLIRPATACRVPYTSAVSIVPAVYNADIIAAHSRYHRRGENWSDGASTTNITDLDSIMASFSAVRLQLQKIMYSI